MAESQTSRGKLVLSVTLLILGGILGVAYTQLTGGKTVTYDAGETAATQSTENRAIDLALRDPRVSALTEGKQCRILATRFERLKIVFDNSTSGTKITAVGEGTEITMRSHTKPMVLVTIIYPDGSGYFVDVSVDEGEVSEPVYAPKIRG